MTIRHGMLVIVAFSVLAVGTVLLSAGAAEESPGAPGWTTAWQRGPLSAEETRAFMKQLARYVFDNHLKKDPNSPQRGMVYEYFDTRRKGHFDQFVQGEGLDTMHDGAWLAAALVNAYRATGDPFFKEFLVQWQLPFYLKMLNHSDELFSWKGAVAREGAKPWGKPWAFQQGEKGFVPYFWDDGGSVSLERRMSSNPLGSRPCVDHLVAAGKPNPRFVLDGYSLGMSNHMSQDLGVMLQVVWLLLRESKDPAERKLADEVARAAKHLHECRVRHYGTVPMCAAAAALPTGDAELLRRVPAPDGPQYGKPGNHYTRFLVDFKPGEPAPLPGFADDQQYRFYCGIARCGGALPRPLAFRTVYDAYTEPQLYRYYSDDAEVPPGINRFDLHPILGHDGQLDDYRSDRRGPFGGPRPIGSRIGPQNMICCGWALQILDAMPGIWEARYHDEFSADRRCFLQDDAAPGKPAAAPAGEIHFASGRLSLQVHRSGLAAFVALEKRRESVVVKLYARPDAGGAATVVRFGRDGSAEALGPDGQRLRAEQEANEKTAKGSVHANLYIPFTVVKGQKPWMNVVEHGRYSIAIDGQVHNIYVAAKEEHVKAWLERELGAGLQTWRAVFDQYGYIPTGIGTGSRWQGISDSGGYAHLISACTQWLMVLDGRRDWELQRVPTLTADP